MLKIVPVVIGILQREGLFLVAKRPPHTVMAGYWEFPGGKVEPQESQEKALARELDEEIGIQLLQASFLKQFKVNLPDRLIELNVWEILSYQGTPYGRETQEIRWIKADAFQSLEFLPSNQSLINFLQKPKV